MRLRGVRRIITIAISCGRPTREELELKLRLFTRARLEHLDDGKAEGSVHRAVKGLEDEASTMDEIVLLAYEEMDENTAGSFLQRHKWDG